ncbi:hypothetical protein BN946_scf184829.g52 [Trametes cinnabarina]|uniref:Uncharacterized protein n=1 Tax=Pycnoporus cinnabarinus TaxID=5643 RepID=A0A060SEW7_PYCCI|nr:hypothetical protein BN946_scf184829.g52 [Trametes cinnabarina]
MALAADPRVAPFTVQEFSDLLSSAFNLHHAQELSHHPAPAHRPILSLTPPSPDQPLFAYHHEGRDSSTRCRDGTTDDEHRGLRFPSQDEGSPQLSPPSRSRTMTALRMFHQVRTRASAFVLRPRALSPSPSPSPPPSPVTFRAHSPALHIPLSSPLRIRHLSSLVHSSQHGRPQLGQDPLASVSRQQPSPLLKIL